MSTDFFYQASRMRGPKSAAKPSKPNAPSGKPVAGRIVNILIGQGYGFIRLADSRQVYFHRADLQEGTAFNDLRIGDAVTFELLDDAVSGARALGVVRRKPSK